MMQNQAAVEALYSATFVEDYLDYVENVPDDLQRHHSRLRELDMSQHQDLLTDLETLVTQFQLEKDPAAQRKLLVRMQNPLISSQDIGDDKIQIVQTLTDTIENKIRQVEHDSQNLDFGRGEEEEQSPESLSLDEGGEEEGGEGAVARDESAPPAPGRRGYSLGEDALMSETEQSYLRTFPEPTTVEGDAGIHTRLLSTSPPAGLAAMPVYASNLGEHFLQLIRTKLHMKCTLQFSPILKN